MIAEFLQGLPRTGPEPIHLYHDRPAPWSEGVVVRFSRLPGSDVIANVQPGHGYASQIVEWQQANAFIIISGGAVYFVRPCSPLDWRCYDSVAIECVVAPDSRNAIISTYTDLLMLDLNGNVSWRRTLAVDGVEIEAVTAEVILGRQCDDPPDRWLRFRVRRHDGQDV